MEIKTSVSNVKIQWLLGILSLAVPLLVCFLFYVPQSGKLGDYNVSILPHINAILNSLTALSLIFGFYFIKSKNIKYHRIAMVSAFIFSSLFLISYVIYHYQGTHVLYGDVDHNGVVSSHESNMASPLKYVYYFILITHIILAAIVIPFVLFALYFAISNQINKHKKIVKYTFPIWLYVAITGVFVYFMISPYYLK